jgi:uncharacterized protein YecE (DUF72 family)
MPCSAAPSIRIGPAGWTYADWNGIVYPAARPRGFRPLAYMAQLFDVIEINTSFYAPLQPPTVQRWLEQLELYPTFCFTAKLWQRFTHESQFSPEDERTFRRGLQPLQRAQRLGALLLQFPYSFHQTTDNRRRLQELLERFGDFPCVVEVRHASWNVPDIYAWLAERGAGFCNIDQPEVGRSLRPTARVTAPLGYIRLHGRRADSWFSTDPEQPRAERYNYLYSLEELQTWAERVRHVSQRARTTFVITNNHFQGKSVVNALQLAFLLTGEKRLVPEPLLEHYPQLRPLSRESPRQPSLFAEG